MAKLNIINPEDLELQRCSINDLQVADKKDALEKFVCAIETDEVL